MDRVWVTMVDTPTRKITPTPTRLRKADSVTDKEKGNILNKQNLTTTMIVVKDKSHHLQSKTVDRLIIPQTNTHQHHHPLSSSQKSKLQV